MKIDKITEKNNQLWFSVRTEDGEYLGTWHIVNNEFIRVLKDSGRKAIGIKIIYDEKK